MTRSRQCGRDWDLRFVTSRAGIGQRLGSNRLSHEDHANETPATKWRHAAVTRALAHHQTVEHQGTLGRLLVNCASLLTAMGSHGMRTAFPLALFSSVIRRQRLPSFVSKYQDQTCDKIRLSNGCESRKLSNRRVSIFRHRALV